MKEAFQIFSEQRAKVFSVWRITYVMANSNAYADSPYVIIVESSLEVRHNRNFSCRLRSLLGYPPESKGSEHDDR